MFLLVQLHSATLDYGTRLSPLSALLLLIMIAWIPLIPYAFLYHSLRNEGQKVAKPLKPSPVHKMMDWVHAHRHPQLVHH